MVVVEVLTGIALVQKSVEFIKSNISTARDIKSLAGTIDDLFRGEQECQKARNKKSGGTGLGEQFGVNTIATEMIDAKIAAEQLYAVSQMVDLRFGHGMWASIIAERAKRIQEQKEAAAAAKRKKLKEDREFEELIKQWVLGGSIMVLAVGLFALLFTVVIK